MSTSDLWIPVIMITFLKISSYDHSAFLSNANQMANEILSF